MGRFLRLGVAIDGRVVDLNFATAWYLAQTGEAEPQRLADALVPANLRGFLRAGIRAIHTAEDLFSGAGPHPSRWWTHDGDAPRGPNDETLVYTPDQVRLRALLPGPRAVSPEDEVAAGEFRHGIAAAIGTSGVVGFALVNRTNGIRALGPYLGRPHDLTPGAGMVVRVNGEERARADFRPTDRVRGIPGDFIGQSELKLSLASGDVIEVEMDGLGVLRNHVR